jgi:hypothetical protein
MPVRKLPQPDKYASCPHEGRVLEYYAGTFDTVFVAFHQFFDKGTIKAKEFEEENWPENPQIREQCRRISWQEILKLTRIASLAELDVGLRTSIGGLKRQFENRGAANALGELNQGIIAPSEGVICPFVEGKLFHALLSKGEKWLWVGDEFCTERKLWWIDDLLSKDIIPSSACCYVPDKSVLITTHWDSHCTFICGSGDKIRHLINEADLEGFYCDEKTEVYWGLD